MNPDQLRQKYLDFFKDKGHVIIPSAPIIPENDPTTLFTGSGMQPMIPFLLGEKHPQGTRICDSQRCFRSQDIEEVGDNRHTTVFEMLGNWSLGDYFKKEQITWMFEYLTKELKLDPKRLYVSAFRGNDKIGIPKDTEAADLWVEQFKSAGINAKAVDFAERDGMQDGRIFFYDEKENWWSRAGLPENMPEGEPGGPDSEMFWDFGADLKLHENSEWKDQPCHPACDCGRFLEIGNNVFMEYIKTSKGFEKLPQKNVDFGGGLERQMAAMMDTPDIFKTPFFTPLIDKIQDISGTLYDSTPENNMAFRVIADHIRAATYIMGDNAGIEPSNVDQGYVVRRLIRRAIRYGKQLGIEQVFTFKVAEVVIDIMKKSYPELKNNKDFIINQLVKEEEKFLETLERGLKEFKKMSFDKKISGKEAFILFSTYGFPIEMTQEIANEKALEVDIKEFEKEMKQHQELSRTASEGKFKGGLADAGEENIKLHTATHLLHAALRKVLGDHVEQRGSNITSERLRFDFSHAEKMTDDEKKQVEDLVNDWISKDLEIVCEEMSFDDAKKQGAIGLFEDKYGDKVKLYTISDISCELCGGPHVKKTGELGSFKIKKEESSSSGIRRIKAILE